MTATRTSSPSTQTGEVSGSAAVDGARRRLVERAGPLRAGVASPITRGRATDVGRRNAVQDVFVHDRQYGTNERARSDARRRPTGGPATGDWHARPFPPTGAWLLSIPRHRTSSRATRTALPTCSCATGDGRDRAPVPTQGAGQRRLRAARTVGRRARIAFESRQEPRPGPAQS